MNNQIVFLVPYFGKLPDYFNAFLQSAANKNFDVLFFSDSDNPLTLPSNCIWHTCSFDEMKKLADDKLGMQVALKHPKKLCDLKPALGLIFSDYITGYQFWGSLDIDIYIGNFDKYINNALLKSIDVFSGIKEYISGSFFIIRNTGYHNNLFKKSRHWQYVFSKEENMIFDECGGRFFKELKAGKTFEEIQPPIESFTEVLFKEPAEYTKLCFENIIAEPVEGSTYVDKNKVLYKDQEYLLVHYIDYKTARTFYTKKKIEAPFFISRFGFFKHKPGLIVVLCSDNFWASVFKKIKRGLKKPGNNA